jgi:hypothetical protein
MRAKEFVRESRTGSLQDDVARALPATWVIPALPNQDPYKQLRFGVAVAAAKGAKERAAEGDTPFAPQTAWGENQIVMSYDPNATEWLDDALKMVGLTASDKVMISTPTSEEGKAVDTKSPVAARKKNKYGV